MENLSLNIIDIITFITITTSAILSLRKGLIREVISIMAWIGAVFITIYSYEYSLNYVTEYISIDIIAKSVATSVTFIISLLVLILVTKPIGILISNIPLGLFDKILGFIYGTLRGIVILSIVYITISYFDNDIDIIKNSKSAPVFNEISNIITKSLPNNFEEEITEILDKAKDKTTTIIEIIEE